MGADIALFPEMFSCGYNIYDRELPESARILMLKGAEIVLVPNACPMEIKMIRNSRF